MRLVARGSRGLDGVVAAVLARFASDSGLREADSDELLAAVAREIERGRAREGDDGDGTGGDCPVSVAFERASGCIDIEIAANAGSVAGTPPTVPTRAAVRLSRPLPPAAPGHRDGKVPCP